MLGQVVRPAETLGADFALVGFNSRVGPFVPGQFIGAGELPAAVRPGAVERLLARVAPQVRLQVRALVVDLRAVIVGAGVDLLLRFVLLSGFACYQRWRRRARGVL